MACARGFARRCVTVWVDGVRAVRECRRSRRPCRDPAGATAPKLDDDGDCVDQAALHGVGARRRGVDADQSFDLTKTYPKYVKQGDTFHVITTSGDTVVPTEQSGITVIQPVEALHAHALLRRVHAP